MQIEIARFHDDEVEAIRGENGSVLIVVKKICTNLDITFSPQRTKLKNLHWSGVTEIVTPDLQGRLQSHTVIPIDSLPMWMATINENKVAEHIGPKLRRYQLEAREVLARHFLGTPTPPPLFHTWAERFRNTLLPHVRHINTYYSGCFSVVSALVTPVLCLEDELIRHMIQPSPRDRPDGSVGQRWANERRRRGKPPVTKRSLLSLPEYGIYVNLSVYDNAERGECESWFYNKYVPEYLAAYLRDKESFKVHGELATASVADSTCLVLTGNPAKLRPPIRKQLDRAGGFCPAGYQPPQFEYAQRTLFDQSA